MKKLIFVVLLLLIPIFLFAGKCEQGNCWNGKGTSKYSSGDVFEGHFKNGLPHGFGILWKFHTYVYEGNFYKGKCHGWIIVRNAETGEEYKQLYRYGVIVRK